MNFGVSLRHLSETEKTENPIEDVSPKTKPNKSQFDNLLFAFVVPFVLHGCYNLFASSNFIVSLGLVLVSWIIALRMFSKTSNPFL